MSSKIIFGWCILFICLGMALQLTVGGCGGSSSNNGSSGTAPAQVTLLAPANNAQGVPIAPLLTWAQAAGASAYDVYLGTTSTGWSPIITNTVLTSFSPSAISYSTIYYWKVDAKNSFGITAGLVWSFTTQIAPPAQATLVSPANNAANTPVNAILAWNAAPGATSYDVYLGPTTTGWTLITSTNSLQYIPAISLQYSTLYYWRVDSKNGTATVSGQVWNFTTQIAPPAQSANPNPANSALDIPITQTFSWAPSAQADSYDVFIGVTNTGWSPVTNTPTVTYTPVSQLLYSTLYYWEVDARNSTATVPGSVWSFTTVPPPPPQVTNPIPADNATGILSDQSLSWNAAPGAASYDVYFGITITNLIFATNTATTSVDAAALPIGIIYNSTFYWRVDARNAGGVTAGPLWKFHTLTAPTQATTPVPANNAIGIMNNQQLGWGAATNASSYDVYFGVTSPGVFITNQTATSFNPGTLSWSTTYYWRVDSKNPGGTVSGPVWQFATLPLPGQAANPIPSNNATGILNNQQLGWGMAANTSYYNVYLWKTGPAVLVISQTALIYNPGTLDWSSVYYWKIDAVNPVGTTAGQTWSFATLQTPPQVTAPNPLNSAIDVPATTALSWAAADRTISYDVYFGDTSTGWTPIMNTTGTRVNIPETPLHYSSNYYWRIDSVNQAGTTVGVIWTFTTEPVPIAAPAQAANPFPATGAINVPLDTQLYWDASAGATSYDVYLSTTVAGWTPITNTVLASYGPSNLIDGLVYYWEIDSRNSAGATAGAVWSFTTGLLAPGALTATWYTIPWSPPSTLPSSQVVLTWTNNASSQTFFNIERKQLAPQQTSYALIGTAGAGAASWTDQTAEQISTYSYRISAGNANGTSGYSNETVVTTTYTLETISGVAVYTGTYSGRIWMFSDNSFEADTHGTSIPGPGPFLIRGFAHVSLGFSAHTDPFDTGIMYNNNIGRYHQILSSATNRIINIPDRPPSKPVTPTFISAFPLDGGAAVSFDIPSLIPGFEYASAYNIYWSSNIDVMNAYTASGGSKVNITAQWNDTVYLNNLANGSSLYFAVTAVNKFGVSAPVTTKTPITIGPVPGSFTVSGVIDITQVISPTGPIYCGVYQIPPFSTYLYELGYNPITKVYGTVINNPQGPFIPYSVTVPVSGTYYGFAFIDMNNNGIVDRGDIRNNRNNADLPVVQVDSAAQTLDQVLTNANAKFVVATKHIKSTDSMAADTYILKFYVLEQAKLPVAATILSGPNIVPPVDLANWGQLTSNVALPNRPQPGDLYSAVITYTDSTTETMFAQVTDVLDCIPTSLTTSGSVLTPTFNWSPPTNPVPGTFTYHLWVVQQPVRQVAWNLSNIPSSQTSVLYYGNHPKWMTSSVRSVALVVSTTYVYQLCVIPDNNLKNEAALQLSYTTPSTVSLPDKATNPWPPNGSTNIPTAVQINWDHIGNATIGYKVFTGITSTALTLFDTQNQGHPGSNLLDLSPNTTYYWRVDTINDTGTTTGDVWSFSTGILPGEATNPTPINNALNMPTNTILAWDTVVSAMLGYDIYLDTTNTGMALVTSTTSTNYVPPSLAPNTTYYWRIDTKNNIGITTGGVWTFTTGP